MCFNVLTLTCNTMTKIRDDIYVFEDLKVSSVKKSHSTCKLACNKAHLVYYPREFLAVEPRFASGRSREEWAGARKTLLAGSQIAAPPPRTRTDSTLSEPSCRLLVNKPEYLINR